jgi:hypothetical protein
MKHDLSSAFWMKEVDRMVAAKAPEPEDGKKTVSQLPKAKMSNVLRCLEEAQAIPELWARIIEESKILTADFADAPKSDPRRAFSSDTSYYVGNFCRYFRLKNSLFEASSGYINIELTLIKLARGEIGKDGIRHSLQNSMIDNAI